MSGARLTIIVVYTDAVASALQFSSDCQRNEETMSKTEQIYNFIDRQKITIISSVDAEGFPNTKAMLAPRRREGNVFYFSTNTSSMRVSQYRDNPRACLYFFDQDQFEGVMLIGTVEVLEDPAIKESIWRVGDTMYYSQGVTDPDYCVLRFSATEARHYASMQTESFAL